MGHAGCHKSGPEKEVLAQEKSSLEGSLDLTKTVLLRLPDETASGKTS